MDTRTAVAADRGPTARISTQAAVGLLAAIWVVVLGCRPHEPAGSTPSLTRGDAPVERLVPAPNVAGDPTEGRRLFVSTGCAGCHTSYDIPGATGVAGPNLTNVVLRPTLAGETIPMTPEILADFVRDPGEIKPGTSMPDLGLTAQEAQHIAAYLYSQPYSRPH